MGTYNNKLKQNVNQGERSYGAFLEIRDKGGLDQNNVYRMFECSTIHIIRFSSMAFRTISSSFHKKKFLSNTCQNRMKAGAISSSSISASYEVPGIAITIAPKTGSSR